MLKSLYNPEDSLESFGTAVATSYKLYDGTASYQLKTKQQQIDRMLMKSMTWSNSSMTHLYKSMSVRAVLNCSQKEGNSSTWQPNN